MEQWGLGRERGGGLLEEAGSQSQLRGEIEDELLITKS